MSDESSAGDRAGTSRSEFLKRTAGVTGLVVGAGVWASGARAASQADPAADAAAVAAAAGRRSFVSGNFALELDGANVGLLKSIEGGDTEGDVVVEPPGAAFYPHKHIGGVKHNDFTVQFGLSMSPPVYDWITNAWQGSNERKDGAIVAADFNYEIKARREFYDALITETALPAMDGSSKDACYLRVTFTPEYAATQKGSGKLTALVGAKQKQWLASNFKLEIDGLDTSRVAKIDSFTVKQGVTTVEIGEPRGFTKVPGKLEFPNLKITLSEAGAESWYDWFDDFVIKGNNGQESERNGTLMYLAPNLKDELGRVELFNLGIFKLAAETMEAGAVKRVVAELYCERREFHTGPQPVG